MKALSRQQRVALKEVFDRPVDTPTVQTYREFRRTAFFQFSDDCIRVWWSGMCLGIERDGYTHS